MCEISWLTAEDKFFNDHAEEMRSAGVPVPRCFVIWKSVPVSCFPCCFSTYNTFICCASQPDWQSCLVMENVASQGYNSKQFFTVVRIEEARAAMRVAAKIHALYWAPSGCLPKDAAPTAMYPVYMFTHPMLDGMKKTFSPTDPKCVDQVCTDWEHEQPIFGRTDVKEMLHALRARARANSKRANQIHQTHNTMVHGDFHAGNLMFKGAATGSSSSSDADGDGVPDLKVIDWQMFGSGNCCVELAYFMNAVVEPVRDTDMALLKEYHACLQDVLGEERLLGGEYTFDAFWRDWAVVCLDWCAAIMARKYKVDTPKKVKEREAMNEGYRKKRRALDSLDERLVERCLWIHTHHYDEFFTAGGDASSVK